ncbi:g4716 [Coccomyxa elongata]
MIGAIFVAAFVLSAVAGQSSVDLGACSPTGPRVACGWNGIDESTCRGMRCCYTPGPDSIGGIRFGLPTCYKANGGDGSYEVAGGALQKGDGPITGTGNLTLGTNGTMPFLGVDISPLGFQAESVDQGILRVKIGAPGRWEVPQNKLFTNTVRGSTDGSPLLELKYSASPFGFAVVRTDGRKGFPLFNTAGSRLVFKDQYIEISSAIPANATLYGLGENAPSTGLVLRRDGIPYALWTRDQAPNVPNVNDYGAHPFIMDVRPGGEAHGVLLMNSNGMDVVLTPTMMQFRTTGGILDLYFLAGPTPMAVLNQLTSIIGRPFMPPYWTLGLMQSKVGYMTIGYCDEVVTNYSRAHIPLETFITDGQYADGYMDFTLSDGYPLKDFRSFVDKLHAKGQRWAPIINPQIHIRPGYSAYDTGIAESVFIKDISGKPYVGQLWPGAVHFPDFWNDTTRRWWTNQLQAFHHELPFDGLWIDMNEASNFCTGDVCYDTGMAGPATDFICKMDCHKGPFAANGAPNVPPEGIFNPPYTINNNLTQVNITVKTIAPTARYLDGELEYNKHSLYGLSTVIATSNALNSMISKRPFILTRSTFLGSGAYAAHWTGNAFIGADICGFQNIATEELCARWAAAGAWQPFSRNHHSTGFQEFYLRPTIRSLAQKAFAWRLRALPYHYTAFFDAHAFGCSVMRPLFFSFPADSATSHIHLQWMLGDAIMVAPILDQGVVSSSAYLPSGVWYDLYNHTAIDASAGGLNTTVQASLADNPPVFVLGGNIVPLGPQGTNTTTALRAGNLTLLVAFPSASSPKFERCGQRCGSQNGYGNRVACGHMYLDQGDEMDVGTAQNNYLAFEAREVTHSGVGTQGSFVVYWPGPPGSAGTGGCTANVTWPTLDTVTVLGVGPVDLASVTIMDIGPQSNTSTAFGTPGTAVVSSESVTSMPIVANHAAPSMRQVPKIVYNPKTKELNISALGYQLRCPNGLKITWLPQANGGTLSQMPTVEPATIAAQSSNSSNQTAIVATPIAAMVDASPPFPTTVTFPDMPLQQDAAPIDDTVEAPMGWPAVWPPSFAPGDASAVPTPAPAPSQVGAVSALSQQAPPVAGG